MHKLAPLDHKFIWHPFTQMRDWLRREPIIIESGKGSVLRDVRGREYLDANSSIWTNLHGHNHPKINAAIQRQLKKIAHSSALGLANEPASLLAKKLVRLANGRLKKVFFPMTAQRRSKSRSNLLMNFRGEQRGLKTQNFFRSKARITATRSARFRLATLTCFTKITRDYCSKQTKSCHRIATAVTLIARSRNAPTRVNIENATGNVSAKLNRNFPRERKKAIHTRRLFLSR
jgi:hypothetical protein